MAKPQKLKARLPRGLADRGPAEIAATRDMVETIRQVYELYGFDPVETPAIEYTDALGKFLPDQDRPNEGVFSFQDDDEQWLSLRYDLTAPLARHVAENYQHLALPYRSYRAGYVYRNEKPGPGRFRQFMQFDADTVGSASMAADAEMCMMAADTMERLGIPRGQYVVKVNSRKILDGVMEAIGLGGDENAARRLIALRAMDKFDRLQRDGVDDLLGSGRKDESGDYTKGANLDEKSKQRLLQLLTLRQHVAFQSGNSFNPQIATGKDPSSLIQRTMSSTIASAMKHHVEQELRQDSRSSLKTLELGLAEIEEIEKSIEAAGYGDGRIVFDTSVVRGLEYYTGPVYEVELLLETKDDKGRPVRFGSVGGGGRYDGLVSRFMGQPVPATGFSIGVSRLQAALSLIGKLGTRKETGPVVVTVFDRDRIADYQQMVAALRNAGIRAELYLGNPKNFGNQMKYADRRNAPCVVIQGPDEKDDPAGPMVIVKDLLAGAELAKDASDRSEHLQRQGEAQRKVAQDTLVETVRDLLQRRGLI